MARPDTIRKRRDFLAGRGAPAFGTPSFLLIRRVRGDDAPARVGFTVTKKIGKAVVRNRVRRRLRAAADATFPEIASRGADYIVIARNAAETRPFEALLDDMRRALKRLSETPK